MLNKKALFKLSAVFALIYFFSPNGIASLPSLSISFLLKNTLHMTASEASYFGAIVIAGWILKPLWGLISDAFPILGLRRKSYLIITTLGAAIVWAILGFLNEYSTGTLLVLFTLSSVFYAFMDVLCDALMIETGAPIGMPARFQSIQWTAVYAASIVVGLAGGYVATNWQPQSVFMLNAFFPLVILAVVLLAVGEKKRRRNREESARNIAVVRDTFKKKQIWLLAFFIFFVAFSPSFGAPFFYYSVDALKFDAMFLGLIGSIAAVSAALGAILYGKYAPRFGTLFILRNSLIFFTLATLFDLVYFIPFLREYLTIVRYVYGVTAVITGVAGAVIFLAILNCAALASPKGGEGTTFATLTAFWNIGLSGSSAIGGLLFAYIGLQPLIVVSALFTGLGLLILPRLRFADEKGFASLF